MTDEDPMADLDAGESAQFETSVELSAWDVAPDELFGRDRDGDRAVTDVDLAGGDGNETIVVTYEADLEKEPVPAIRKRPRHERDTNRPWYRKALSAAPVVATAWICVAIAVWITEAFLSSTTINGDRIGAVGFWEVLGVFLLVTVITIVVILGPALSPHRRVGR
jgi:hypothetical protein